MARGSPQGKVEISRPSPCRRASAYSGRDEAHVESFRLRWMAGGVWFRSRAAQQRLARDRIERSFHPQDWMLVALSPGA